MNLKNYTQETKKMFTATQSLANHTKNQSIEPEHLLYILSSDSDVQTFVKKIGGNSELLTSKAAIGVRKLPVYPKAGANFLSPRLVRLSAIASQYTVKFNIKKVSGIHLLLAFFNQQVANGGTVKQTLESAGLTEELIESSIGVNSKTLVSKNPTDPDRKKTVLEECSIDMVEQAKLGKLGPVIGRTDELRRIIQILCRSLKNNPILIGKPGVGKSAIVEALAIRMASGDVPNQLQGKRLLTLELSSVVAGATLRGEYEKRLKSIIDEVKDSAGEIILFVDEVHSMVSSSESSNPASLLKPALARGEIQIFGATTADEFRLIEKDKALDRRFQSIYIEEPTVEQTLSILRGIKSKFENTHGVKIQDPALEAAVTLSKRYVPSRNLPDKAIDLIDEAASRLRIELDSVPREIDQLERKISNQKMELLNLVDQSHESTDGHKEKFKLSILNDEEKLVKLRSRWENEITLIQSIQEMSTQHADMEKESNDEERVGNLKEASRLRFSVLESLNSDILNANKDLLQLRIEGSLLREEIQPEDIASIIADMTGIPVSTMMESERDKLVRMEEEIGKRVIGQAEAMTAISTAVRRSRAGLNDPNRPVGSFFFLGPSGVGKTELAKALTCFLFGDESNLIRLDMSEFMEKHTVARLIGAPPGYKGADEGGQLTEAVRLKPYSVVLFDEVEKGHPDVFNVLLQILDDGRLTDSQGNLIDFKNTVIIMTSNVGSSHLLESTMRTGCVTEDAKELAMDEMRTNFRPEFLGRIDEIVMFHGLTKENIEAIADIQIKKIDKLLSAKKLKIKIEPEAVRYLVEIGYQPAYGARPLRRSLQKNLQDPLSMEILKGGYSPGDTIKVKLSDDGLNFTKA